MRLFRAVAAALFLAAFLAAAARAAEPCVIERFASMPFETDGTAHVFVPATAQGRATRMMIDTGGFWSLVTEAFADELNLERRRSTEVWVADSSGARLDKYIRIPDMKIGPLPLGAAFDFIISKNMGMRSTEQFGGTLGLNIFSGVDVEIDNAAKTISLYKPSRCEGAYWSDDYVTLRYRRDGNWRISMPVVTAELEGETIRALLDTGSTVSSLKLGVAKRRFGIGPGSPGVELSGQIHLPGGKIVEVYSYTFKTLVISGITFSNVPVHLGDFEEAELILGMNELKHLRLYFAFKHRMIHVTAADAGR
jgi:predicted aspartyl protease